MDRVPGAERTATPFDLFRLAFGGANTFSTCALGAFPGPVRSACPSPAIAAVLYLSPLRLFPEPRAVYGPEGPRPARAVDVPVPVAPITGPGAGVDGTPLSDPSATLRP
ncbi:hypothetical protein [Streptomyces sp. NPDC014995]|uniref:hypothetical protein n=1 Tax=Streptomyces sp. NPDC014995 TaxID=3364936 RepID=UPI0036F6FA75